ncbi:DNA-binding protein [Prauserella marina]|uniref:Predicted DNA-binding transcriptional regulator YafY, contains an HTH and WYL domains n=1 Tax=Prauserella marina TaxID=530584 RepID=A0A222VVC1_9PSEU|nr:WYL domain-containing protein [Prauserella marina]ASR37877.1 DNA-binding protein [Prauserella marina]PWV73077.1 putative DNA-binding transcriptional regulator YafY [Prauserella marina]SDD72450.1 Predicted DNA-binding transcriptional regulator YafY, contains an HTH and WYL domains [Prauserella marina]
MRDEFPDRRPVRTTSRRLEVLALLQAYPGISAPRLAARLGVTERTARRDVAQLREIGYRIEGEPGREGGYRLGPGRAMPPVPLDADEVAAVAIGLRTAAGVAGLETAAVTALSKLTKLTGAVPARWHTRLAALGKVEAQEGRSPRAADRDVLITVAIACGAGEAIRIKHRARGAAKAVDVLPHRLVALRRNWYLVAATRDALEWRVYALDRIAEAQPLGIRLPVPDPPSDAVAFVTGTLADGPWRHAVRVRVYTSADLVRELVDPSVATVAAGDEGECELRFGTDDLGWAARWLTYLNLDIDVLEPEALADELRALGGWLAERY